MTHSVHIDLETRSAYDLKAGGVHNYAKHPTTSPWCACFAPDDEAVQEWRPGEKVPELIRQAVHDDWEFIAHNAAFERPMIRDNLGPRHGWPVPKLRQWRCTMAMAQAMSLPGSLENAAAAVGLNVGKDMEGHSLMMRMARPRSNKDGKIVWWNDADRITRLVQYCKTDVEVERQLCRRLMSLRPFEQEVYFIDQVINDRGVRIDTELCRAAQAVVEEVTERLNHEMTALTSWKVTACTKAGKLIEWLNEQGVETASVDKDNVRKMLSRPDIPDRVRRVLEIRQEAAKSSTAKIKAMLSRAGEDERARGLLTYHAASTGRWGGRAIQPQNMPRPSFKFHEIEQAIGVML